MLYPRGGRKSRSYYNMPDRSGVRQRSATGGRETGPSASRSSWSCGVRSTSPRCFDGILTVTDDVMTVLRADRMLMVMPMPIHVYVLNILVLARRWLVTLMLEGIDVDEVQVRRPSAPR